MGSGSASPQGSSATGILAFLGVWALTATILSTSGYTGVKAFLLGLCLAVIAYEFEAMRSHARKESASRRRGRWGVIALSLVCGLVVIAVAAAGVY